MKPYYQDDAVTIYHGDNLPILQSLADDSIDAIVTDPPYGLLFMGKKWDYDVPSVEVWAECLRVLKPGGHLLAFAGTRTQHRMACRIEDAGFEIRDMIAWVYGSGFPKSLDVSKAIDKAAGAQREVVGLKDNKGRAPGLIACKGLNVDAAGDPITAPATDAARQWQGYGTALKPSLEPITMARKPIVGTVAENVLAHGTGGINVDGCRVGTEAGGWGGGGSALYEGGLSREGGEARPISGRWPANLIHDGSDEVVGLFPEGSFNKPTMWKSDGAGADGNRAFGKGVGKREADTVRNAFGDSGSAARFFYCAKSDASERRGSKHPTVKPLALMRYLVRMVTPIGATVLDPFMGSGTTIEAARLESCKSIGIDREAEYCEDAAKRLSQGVLF